jgi:hypothetical protein
VQINFKILEQLGLSVDKWGNQDVTKNERRMYVVAYDAAGKYTSLLAFSMPFLDLSNHSARLMMLNHGVIA